MRGAVLPLLVGLILVALGAATVRADDPATVTFTDVGEHAFTVPGGVTSLHIVATGAPGGGVANAAGGTGAIVTGDVAVTPGALLYVEVGGPGTYGAAGANGGGAGTYGGGGASDVRTKAVGKSGTLASRLIIAAGGGGGGGGAGGGNAGHAGKANSDATGGRPGSSAKGGAGGTGLNTPGDGSLGQGGHPANAGGGGGGGLYGGGAGNGSVDFFGASSGGGGGSSGAAAGVAGLTKAVAATTQPSVAIAYTVPAPPPPGTTPTPAPTETVTVTPTPTPTPSRAKPALTAVTLPKRESGKRVILTAQIGQSRSSLRGKLRYGKHHKLVGSVTRAPLNAGPRAVTIKLNKAGRRLHRHHHKLRLVVSVRVTPPVGAPVTLTKHVILTR